MGELNKTQKASYSSVVSPKIHSSQIAGTSSMEVPKLPSKPQFNLQIPTKNPFSVLVGDESDMEPITPTKSPIRRKRTQTSPQDQPSLAKKAKITVVKKDAETSTPTWNFRDVGIQTKPTNNEKIIIPTIYKNLEKEKKNKDKKMGPSKTKMEEIPEGIDYNNVDDIIRHLGKNVVKSGNLILIVKLLGALISKLTNAEVDEGRISKILTSPSLLEIRDP